MITCRSSQNHPGQQSRLTGQRWPATVPTLILINTVSVVWSNECNGGSVWLYCAEESEDGIKHLDRDYQVQLLMSFLKIQNLLEIYKCAGSETAYENSGSISRQVILLLSQRPRKKPPSCLNKFTGVSNSYRRWSKVIYRQSIYAYRNFPSIKDHYAVIVNDSPKSI